MLRNDLTAGSVATRPVSSTEIPIGILAAIFGVPLFIIIFRKNEKGW